MLLEKLIIKEWKLNQCSEVLIESSGQKKESIELFNFSLVKNEVEDED